MAKKKKPVETPKSPPRDLSHAMLLALRAEITDQECADYVRYIFEPNPSKVSMKQKKATTRAVLMFAALGFQFYSASRAE